MGAKLLPTDFIAYPLPVINSAGEVIDEKLVTPLPENSSTKSPPGEWVPKEPAQFGKALLQGGLTQFNESTRLNSGTTIESSHNLAPTFLLGGDVWLTTNWFVDFNFMQSYFRTENGLAGCKK